VHPGSRLTRRTGTLGVPRYRRRWVARGGSRIHRFEGARATLQEPIQVLILGRLRTISQQQLPRLVGLLIQPLTDEVDQKEVPALDLPPKDFKCFQGISDSRSKVFQIPGTLAMQRLNAKQHVHLGMYKGSLVRIFIFYLRLSSLVVVVGGGITA